MFRHANIVLFVTRRQQTGNLPAELNSFVGRDLDLAEVKKALSNARLVTLTGVGGVGKTRLALRAAAQLARTFPDGAWLAELASAPEPDLLVQTIADSLRIRDYSLRAPLDTMIDHLRDKRLLLVLDNCEHLLDKCAGVVASLLDAAPGLRILATSRHPLRVAGERPIAVLPMPVPDADRGELLANEAARLFVERAKAVTDESRLVDEAAQVAIARICRRLEGLPLAIELAAARLRALSTQHLADRLDDRFPLLTLGNRSAPRRQQTLRNAIEWSYDLCSPQERLLWARVSVFAGEFDLPAAEDVCGGHGIDRAAVTGLLASLADKSVLNCVRSGQTPRYRILDTVRQFGQARLSQRREAVAVRRRHRDYYWRLARLAEGAWISSAQSAWSDRLHEEHANLRFALDFCCTEPGEAIIGLGMAASLWTYWIPCGAPSEGHHWLAHALALAPQPTPIRAKALWVAGWVAQNRGDLAGATALLQESRVLAEELGYEQAIAYALQYSARAAMSQGDYGQALALHGEALARHRALGDEMGVVTLLTRLALCHFLRNKDEYGDLDLALALIQECIWRCESAGEKWCLSSARYVQGLVLWAAGRNSDAEELAVISLRPKHAFHDEIGVGLSLELLAWIFAATGRPERAAHLLGATARIWDAVGIQLFGIKHLLEFSQDASRRACRELGQARFAHAYSQGAQVPLERVVNDTLGRPSARPLTPRERQVAELAAQGLTNKEIANSLAISPRTAETHVQRILAKLGITTRTDVAVRLDRVALLPKPQGDHA